MSVSHRHSLAIVLIACLILGLVSPPRAGRAQAPVPAVPLPEATEIVEEPQQPTASAITSAITSTLPSPPQIIVGSTFSTDRAKNGQLIEARLVLRAVSELESPDANLTVTVTLPEGLEFVDGSSKLALHNPSQRQLTWRAISVMPETNFMDRYQLLVRAASTPINLAIHTEVNGGAVDCCAVMPANIMVRGDRRAPQSVNAMLDGRVRVAERVSVDFAPAAFKSNLAVGVTEFAPLLVTGTLPGLFFPFELEPDTEPGEVFGAPVTLTVDLEGLVPFEAAQAGMRPVLLYFRPEVITRTVVIDGDADVGGAERVITATIEGAQEIDSTYDVETKRLTAQLTHFSGYAISFSQPKPEPWKLSADGGEVSLFRGAATYAYPIILPAALDSQTPDISLHYSSAAADSGSDGSLPGLGLSTGKGWDLSIPRITRVVQRRWQLAPWKTGSEWWNNWSKCSFYVHDYWAYCYPYLETRYANDFTLTLGGQNHNLVPKFDVNAQAGGEYVTEDYQPLRIVRCNARYPCAGNDVVPGVDNTTGEYWQVWTPDGTRYVFGADTNSTNLVRAEALNANTDVACYNGAAVAHAAYAGTGGADNCAIPRIWFLKRVYAANRDSAASGRWSIEYSYAAGEDDIYGPGPQPCDACHAQDPWLRPASILYGPSLRSNGQAATKRYKVQFAYSWGPRLSSISTGVADANGNVTTWLRRYAIRVDQGWPGYPSASHVLYDIAEQTWNGSAWVTGLPLTGFTYTELPHNNGHKTLLKKVANGYGAEWEYAYAGDAGMNSYWVITATTRNGMGWESLHTYEYSPERCFSTDAYAGQCVNAAHVHWDQWPNTLIGFRQVTEKVRDASNATLSTAIHTYHYADLKLLGREHTTRVTGAAGAVLQATQTDYLVQNGPSYVPANSWFVAPSMVREYLAGDVGSSPYRRTDYAYNAAFGNVTAIYEHGLYGIAGDERSTHLVYSPNSASWIVNKVARENVYDAITEDTGGTALKSQSWLYYDGSSSNSTSPTKGFLTKIERGLGAQRVTQLAGYDAAGHLSSVTDGRGFVTTGGYDADGWFLLWLRNAANHLTQYVRYGVNDGACIASGLSGLLGSVKCAIDPNGASTAYGYDAYGRLTSVVRPYDSASIPTLRYQYSDAGQTSIAPPLKIETLQRETGGCANCTHSAIEFFDGLGRPVQSRIESGNGAQQRVVNTTYDPLGLVQHSYEPVFESASTVFVRPAGWDAQPRSTMSYDALGRPAVISHTNGTATRMSYSVESTGLTTVVTDALGRRSERVADGREQLTAVREFSGTAAYTTRYQYDVFGNLTRLIDAAGNQTTLTYDALGRKTVLNDPDLGTWSYAYDGNSNLVSQTDARGQVLRFDYDALNRMTRKWLNSSNATLATYAYDTGVYAIGRRTSMSNANDTTTWSYDARGRIITESRTIAGVGGPYQHQLRIRRRRPRREDPLPIRRVRHRNL